jgi:hypothetical protein
LSYLILTSIKDPTSQLCECVSGFVAQLNIEFAALSSRTRNCSPGLSLLAWHQQQFSLEMPQATSLITRALSCDLSQGKVEF